MSESQQQIGNVVEAAVAKGKSDINDLIGRAENEIEKREDQLQGGLQAVQSQLASGSEAPTTGGGQPSQNANQHAQEAIGNVVEAAVAKGKNDDKLITAARGEIDKREASLQRGSRVEQASLTEGANVPVADVASASHAQVAIGSVVEAAVAKGKEDINKLMATADEKIAEKETELEQSLPCPEHHH